MKKRKLQIGILFIMLVLCAIFCYWQNNGLEYSYYQYETDKIGNDLDGYKIIQISDLHNKEFGKNQEKLLDRINRYGPDMIVVTGDIVDSNHTDVDAAITFLEGAVKLAPVYYITGNHEYWLTKETREDLFSRIVETGTNYLDNSKVEIKKGNDSFVMIGLDDECLKDPTLQTISKDITNQFTLLLAHEPQNLNRYSQAPVDLVLSGHAHGGQVILPFIGGLVAPDQGFFPEYTAGWYEENGTSMIVSRGLGNSVIPIRVFNRPEIVCVELKCK